MKALIGRLKDMLFVKHQYRADVNNMKEKRKVLDDQIQRLERRATVDGDEGWFLTKVRRDPSCALKVLRECDKNGDI